MGEELLEVRRPIQTPGLAGYCSGQATT